MVTNHNNQSRSGEEAKGLTGQSEFDLLFELLPDMICIVSSDGYFKKLNRAWEGMLGYRLAELLQSPMVSFIHPDDVESTHREITRQVERQDTIRYANRFRTKAGGYRWLEWHATPARDGESFYAMVRDITGHKQMEQDLLESEARWRSLVSAAPVRITLVDRQGKIIFINRTSPGRTVENTLGSSIYDYQSAEEQVRTRQILDEVFRTGTPRTYDTLFHRQDGKTIWYENKVGPVEQNGEVTAVLFISSDITDRKMVEEERDQHLHQLQAVLANASLVLSAVDMEGKYILSEGKGLAAMGITSGQLPDKTIFEIYQDRSGVISGIQAAMHGETASASLELNGETIEAHFEPLRKAGMIAGVVVVNNIVTARKQAEEALRFSELGLREAQAVARIGNWKWNIKNREVTWSDEMYRIFGIEKDTYTGRLGDVIAKVIHPDDLYLVLPSNAANIAKGPIEYRIILPDQSIRHIWAKSGGTLMDEAGNPMFLTGIAQDITERKQAEETIRASEERFRTLFQTMIQGVVYQDAGGNIISANPAAERILGLTLEQLQGRTSLDPRWHAIHENGSDFPGEEHPAMLALRSGQPVQNVIMGVYHPQTENYVWINVNAMPLYKPNEATPYQVYATFEDITVRKSTEEALKDNLKRLNMILANAPLFLSAINKKGEYILSEGKGLENMGLKQGQLPADTVYEIYRDEPDILDHIKRAMDGESVVANVSMSGEILETHYEPLREDSGAIIGIMSMSQIITERKRAEEALRESEFLLRTIAENYPNSYISIIEKDLTVGFTSGQAFKKLNLNPHQFVGLTLEQVFGEEAPFIREQYLKTFEGIETHFELLVNEQHQDYRTVPLVDQHGNINRILSVVENITERKRAEEALRESETKLQSVLMHSQDAIGVSKAGMHVFANPAYAAMFGYQNDAELIGTPIINCIAPESRALFIENVLDRNRGVLAPSACEVAALRNDGNKFIMDVSVSTYSLKGEQFTLMILRDITERKRAEEELVSTTDMLRRTGEMAKVGGWELDLATNRMFFSREALLINEVDPREEFTFEQAMARVDPGSRAALQAAVKASIDNGTSYDLDLPMVTTTGRHIWSRTQGFTVMENGKAVKLVGAFQDITERKLAEEASRESEARFRGYFEQGVVGVAVTAPDKGWVAVNQALCDTVGYTQEELSRLTWAELTHPEDLAVDVDQFNRVMAGEIDTYRLEKRLICKDGHIIYVDLGIRCKRKSDGQVDYFLALLSDITERKQGEEQIKKALVEKETLLRELYHRTKNNMAVVIALLELQSNSFEDERLRDEFVEAQNRIRSMALVHQKLYETKDLSRINLKDYIQDLLEILLESYRISPAHIEVVLELEDVFVLIDSAIPCGLILNELISNAFKYAFPNGRDGKIEIQLCRTSSEEIEIAIADHGVGVPPGFDFHRDGHLGVQNILILAENQLQGKVTFDTTEGVACRIQFKDIYFEPRI